MFIVARYMEICYTHLAHLCERRKKSIHYLQKFVSTKNGLYSAHKKRWKEEHRDYIQISGQNWQQIKRSQIRKRYMKIQNLRLKFGCYFVYSFRKITNFPRELKKIANCISYLSFSIYQTKMNTRINGLDKECRERPKTQWPKKDQFSYIVIKVRHA